MESVVHAWSPTAFASRVLRSAELLLRVFCVRATRVNYGESDGGGGGGMYDGQAGLSGWDGCRMGEADDGEQSYGTSIKSSYM